MFRRIPIIVTRNHEELAGGKLGGFLVPLHNVFLRVVKDVSYTSIFPGVLPTDLGGPIGREIVEDNQFEIPVVLRQKRFEGLRQESLAIPNGHPNADSWLHDAEDPYSRFRSWHNAKICSSSNPG